MNDVTKVEIGVYLRLGEQFVERLARLERQYRDPRQDSGLALAEFDSEWPRLRHTFQLLAPLIHNDAQIAEICRKLPVACPSIFFLRLAKEDRLEWLFVALDATKQLRASRKEPLREFELVLCGEIGSVLLDCGRFSEAERVFQAAVALAQSLSDKNSEAKFLGNVAVALAEMREFQRALQLSEESLQLAWATGFRRLYGDQLRLSGTICVDIGDYPRALEFLFRALEAHIEGRHPLEVSTDLGEIGVAFKAQGDSVRAKQFLTKARDASRDLGYKRGEQTWRGHLQRL